MDVGGQGPPHPIHGQGQRLERMLSLHPHRAAGDLGSHVRVAVPVPADPGTEPDKGRDRTGDRTGGRPDQRHLGGPIQAGHGADQGLVEHRHHGAHLVERLRLGGAQDRRPVQQFDLLQQPAPGDSALVRTEARVAQPLQLFRHPAQRGGDGTAPGLGGVRSQDRMDPQGVEHLGGAIRGGGHLGPQRVAGVAVTVRGPLEQACAVAFIGQVHQMQMDGERSREVAGVGHTDGGQIQRRRRGPVVQRVDLIGDDGVAGFAQHLCEGIGEQPKFPAQFGVAGGVRGGGLAVNGHWVRMPARGRSR